MADHNALTVKCRAIRSTLLVREDYERLSRAEDLSDFEALLARNERYKNDLLTLGGASRRSDIEHRMRRLYFALYEKLAIFCGGDEGRFIRSLLFRFDIVYIMRAIKAIDGGEREKYAYLPKYLLTHSEVDFAKIYTATDYPALISALAGTRYHGPAAAYLSGETPDAITFERVCYREYYSALYGVFLKGISAQDAQSVKEVLDKRIELSDTYTALRARDYPFRTCEDIINTDRRGYYEGIADGSIQPPDPDTLARELCEYCENTLSAGKGLLGDAVALLLLAERELINLTHITEGIRYGADPDAVMEKIICR